MNTQQWNGTKTHLDNIETLIRGALPEERYAGAAAVVIWHFGGWAYLAKNGADLRGWSLSHRQKEWLLCVRATVDELPVVAFMSSSSTTGCFRKMLERLDDGSIRFYPDKFA